MSAASLVKKQHTIFQEEIIMKEVIKNIKKSGKNYTKIYVCSPLSAETTEGIERNMLAARLMCQRLNNIFADTGIRAWAPHAYLPEFLNDNIPDERKLGIDFGCSLLKMSDAIVVFGSKLSNGMKAEIKISMQIGIPIYVTKKLMPVVMEFMSKVKEADDD